MFQNAFLHPLHAVMVVVQHLFGILHVQVVLRVNAPRQIGHRLQVSELRLVFGHLRIHALQFFHFARKHGLHLIRHYATGQFFLQVESVRSFIIAQFTLNLLHLLAQEKVLLLFIEFIPRTHLDIMFEHRQLTLARKHFQQFHCALFNVVHLQEFKPLILHQRHVGTDKVNQEHRVRNVAHGKCSFFATNFLAHIQIAHHRIAASLSHSLEFFILGIVKHLFERTDFSPDKRFASLQFLQFNGSVTLQNSHR